MNKILLIGCFALMFGFFPLLYGFNLFSLQSLFGIGISICGLFLIFIDLKNQEKTKWNIYLEMKQQEEQWY